jgi:alpha-ketoglutaric semialdehyde dehydrogenase
MTRTYGNFISGEWRPAASGKTFENRNPADTSELIGLFAESGKEDLDAAVAAAKKAYQSWRLVPAPKRAEFLYAFAERLIAKKEEFAKDLSREMGKALREARGDVQEAIDIALLMAGEGRRLYGVTTPSEMPNKFQMAVRQSIGVAGFITPWNFPMAIPCWKSMPAILCGNTVVVKPATDTPLSVIHVAEIWKEVGLPAGVFNVVTGKGSTVGSPLVEHPDVSIISFTGSTEVGRGISVGAAKSFKKCHLEMGGKNAIMVMEDGDVELAADGAIWGAFGTAGQRCTASSRLIVHKDVVAKFTEIFVAKAKALRVGNPLDESVDVGPVSSKSQVEKIMEYVGIGRDQDKAKLLCGGVHLNSGEHAKGYFIQPTVFGDVHRDMRIAREEIFGPVTDIIPVGSLEEAIDVTNDTDFGLSASIFTKDVNKAMVAMRDVYTGIFYVNSATIGAEVHLPFGGVKQTGNGHREAGVAGIEMFTEWKSVYVDFSGRIQKAQIDEVKVEG